MKNAIVFNPAKLNSKYYDGKINNYNKTLNAFVVSGDILNVVFGDPQSGIRIGSGLDAGLGIVPNGVHDYIEKHNGGLIRR
ncbi:MAG: hypothetical protein P1P64_00510 [Treponemataceae bacterium]